MLRVSAVPVLAPLAVVFVALVVLTGLLWLLFAIKGTIGWTLSGEAGALLNRGVATHVGRLRRTVETRTILGHLALAARLNLPLPSALRAAARGEQGRVARSLKHMAYLLGTGLPVSAAVDSGVPGCSPLLVSILKKGERCGQLASALNDVERMLGEITRGGRSAYGRFTHAGAYALFMFLFCLLVVTWFMVTIVPKFKDIFMDFDTELPWITISLIGVSQRLLASGMGSLLLFVVLPLVLLGIALACTSAISRVSSTDEVPFLLRVIGTVRWSLPVTRSIDFGLGMATAIRALSFGLRAGLPVDRAVDLASTVGGANHLRYRLSDFAAEVRMGVQPRVAAKRAGLGEVFSSALAMIERGEDAETALRHAADYYQAVAFRWWHAVARFSGPVVTLLIAAMVGYIALALFLPLIGLVNASAECIV